MHLRIHTGELEKLLSRYNNLESIYQKPFFGLQTWRYQFSWKPFKVISISSVILLPYEQFDTFFLNIW